MDDEIVDLNPPIKEEPWCSVCADFSDYKRKWTTYPRANLDGGTYPENIEVPHCIECGSSMQFLSSSRLLVCSVRIICFALVTLTALLLFQLYEFSIWTVFLWSLSIMISMILSKAPVASRKALFTYRNYLEKQKN